MGTKRLKKTSNEAKSLRCKYAHVLFSKNKNSFNRNTFPKPGPVVAKKTAGRGVIMSHKALEMFKDVINEGINIEVKKDSWKGYLNRIDSVVEVFNKELDSKLTYWSAFKICLNKRVGLYIGIGIYYSFDLLSMDEIKTFYDDDIEFTTNMICELIKEKNVIGILEDIKDKENNK